MLVLDGHESHLSVDFQEYCTANNIIPLCLPPHSSHITQPLDVGCFSVLKRMYGREIELYMKARINHITKVEFFIAFHAAFKPTFTPENARAGFRGSGLVPFDPEVVIAKLDIKLRTPSPPLPPTADANPWVSQTPRNLTDTLSQSTLVKSRIARHQSSSPTSIFGAVASFAKGTEIMAHKMTLMEAENRLLRQSNEALSKRRRAKKT